MRGNDLNLLAPPLRRRALRKPERISSREALKKAEARQILSPSLAIAQTDGRDQAHQRSDRDRSSDEREEGWTEAKSWSDLWGPQEKERRGFGFGGEKNGGGMEWNGGGGGGD